jgi:hypothetical protein
MRKVVIKGIYKHFKGDSYIVEDVAIDSEDDHEVVIYRPLYGDSKILYVRSLESFLAEVDKNKYPTVKQKYRFSLQKIKSVRK